MQAGRAMATQARFYDSGPRPGLRRQCGDTNCGPTVVRAIPSRSNSEATNLSWAYAVLILVGIQWLVEIRRRMSDGVLSEALTCPVLGSERKVINSPNRQSCSRRQGLARTRERIPTQKESRMKRPDCATSIAGVVI